MMTQHETSTQHGIATQPEIATFERQLVWNSPWPGQSPGVAIAYATLDGLCMRGVKLDGLVLLRVVNLLDRSVLVSWAVRDTSRPHAYRGEWPPIVGPQHVSPVTCRLADLEYARRFR